MMSPEIQQLSLQQLQQVQTELTRLSSVLAHVGSRLEQVHASVECTARLYASSGTLALPPKPVDGWSPLRGLIRKILEESPTPLRRVDIHLALARGGVRVTPRGVAYHLTNLVRSQEITPMPKARYTVLRMTSR